MHEVQQAPQYSALERLYIEQALYKAIAEDVSTKGEGLRAAMDSQLAQDYYQSGIKSRDAFISGQKVGTYSVRLSKPNTEPFLSVVNRQEFERWCLDNGYARQELVTVIENEEGLLKCLLQDGEAPDGTELVQPPEQAPKVIGTTLRVDVEAVKTQLNQLNVSQVLQLEAGER